MEDDDDGRRLSVVVDLFRLKKLLEDIILTAVSYHIANVKKMLLFFCASKYIL